MQKNTDAVLFWIGLSSIPGVGRTTFRKLVHAFGSPEHALTASSDELKESVRLSDKVIDEIKSSSWREYAEQEFSKAQEAGIGIITMADPQFPEGLKKIPDPPNYLYVKGALRPEDARAVAIVGTRRPTHYGKTTTQRIAGDLARAGFTIVSGLARGIDTQAHFGALAAKGRTIAVLGCGIDVAYPPENKGLIDAIAASGAIIAENPFGTQPEAGFFPARNRIISGLARGTVIVEASEDSGSLITAKNAIEQGRKLFAVPGNIGSATSKGPNNLIKQGALLVESAEDIRQHLGSRISDAHGAIAAYPLPPLTQEEENVFHCITHEPKHIDIIMNESRSAAGKLGGVLINLELKGLAKQLPGKYFVRQE